MIFDQLSMVTHAKHELKELTISSLYLMLKKEKASLLSPSPTGNEVTLKEDNS